MRRSNHGRNICGSLLLLSSCAALSSADAYTLWSLPEMSGGAGRLHWPAQNKSVPLSGLTLRHLAFVANQAFRVPFSNNAGEQPNICANGSETPTGQLSNGAALNENVDACALDFGGRRALMTVARGKDRPGEPLAFFDDNGDLVVAAEYSIDFGEGRVVDVPLLSTTGSVQVPHPTAARAANKADPAYGSRVSGMLGDTDGDGWIDGILVAVGIVPADAPVAAGETFILYRNFQMDVPVSGVRSGNVRELGKQKQ